ncbi:MAG: hypothetical protein H7210_02060 [Pyrinomonadaceae bacterium]|nr:hypothetical protein [Phycisphaerales bacterium]
MKIPPFWANRGSSAVLAFLTDRQCLESVGRNGKKFKTAGAFTFDQAMISYHCGSVVIGSSIPPIVSGCRSRQARATFGPARHHGRGETDRSKCIGKR